MFQILNLLILKILLNQSIMGGFIIRFDGKEYNASVKAKLK